MLDPVSLFRNGVTATRDPAEPDEEEDADLRENRVMARIAQRWRHLAPERNRSRTWDSGKLTCYVVLRLPLPVDPAL